MGITMHSFVSMYSHRNFSINDLPCASRESIESTLLLGRTDITVCEKKLTAHRPFYLDWDYLNTNYDISDIRFWKKKKTTTVSFHCLSVICKLKLPLLTSPSCLESKEIRQCVQKNVFIHHQIDTQELPHCKDRNSELWILLLLNDFKRCADNRIHDYEYSSYSSTLLKDWTNFLAFVISSF